jgi:hypothetical protein
MWGSAEFGPVLCLSAVLVIKLSSAGALAADAAPSPQKGLSAHSAGPTNKIVPVTEAGPSKGQSNGQFFAATVRPFVKKYCAECHGRESQNAGINFDTSKDFAAARGQRKTWEKAQKMLSAGSMPPIDHERRPSEAEARAICQWIDRAFFDVDCSQCQDPGHVTIRRLNRAEYNNTVRDLLGVTIRPADDFPSDDVGNGFDNMGDVLSLSPLLMEKYVAAAERLASVALFGVDPVPLPLRHFIPHQLKREGPGGVEQRLLHGTQYQILSSTGSAFVEFSAPSTGDYLFRVLAGAEQAGGELAKMGLRVDGKQRKAVTVTGHLKLARYGLRARLTRGNHRLSAAFLNDFYDPAKKLDRNLLIASIEVEGPYREDGKALAQASAAARERILFCRPSKGDSPRDCARRILERLATRAFRRPIEPGEIEPYVDLAESATPHATFDRGISAALTAMLVSPHFLFRVEQSGDPSEGTAPMPVGVYELASRLSYFLWSSMPDEHLFRLASDGSLARPEVLRPEILRMLRDSKSQALVTNFGGQWLNLTQLATARPSPEVFGRFPNELRNDMRGETEQFFGEILREDRSLLDLLNGKYTFLNDRLARHYGIANVKGAEFRRVSLEGYPRAGILTQGSILTLTSQRTRTSPVKRGKWIMETLLGTAPPPPPPNIPDLREAQSANPKASLREQLAIHRKKAACASCHKVMDPLGFGLENFDGVGRWREKEGDRPVDATGTLPGGESFKGPIELIGILTKQEDTFRRHLARTLMTYALGREIEYYDKCAIDRVVEGTRRGGDRFSALVTEIVLSDPFLKRRGGGNQNGP